jgi:hypothetical protein
MIRYGVALFHTTSAVMQAEKAIMNAGIAIKLVPTPREFSNDCGISIRFDWTVSEQIQSVLTNSVIEFDTIHLMGDQNKSQGGPR